MDIYNGEIIPADELTLLSIYNYKLRDSVFKRFNSIKNNLR